jgi:hypothetical protein
MRCLAVGDASVNLHELTFNSRALIFQASLTVSEARHVSILPIALVVSYSRCY